MKISVLMPNYNKGMYIGKAIRSVLNQSYKDIELIIVDDASEDKSMQEIRHFKNAFNPIKVFENPSNVGFPETLKECLKNATGDIIFGLASDDHIASMAYFQKAVDLFTQYPTIGLVWAKTALYYNTGEHFTTLGCSSKEVFHSGVEFLNGFLKKENFVAGYSAIFRKSSLEGVGGFQFDLGPQTDYFPNHAVPSVFGGAFINDVMTNALVFRDKSNYSTSDKEEDRIVRHAIFEKRMRALGKVGIEEGSWLSWRKDLIKDIATQSQEYAFDKFQKIMADETIR